MDITALTRHFRFWTKGLCIKNVSVLNTNTNLLSSSNWRGDGQTDTCLAERPGEHRYEKWIINIFMELFKSLRLCYYLFIISVLLFFLLFLS